MKENLKPKLIFILIVFLVSLYVAIPSLGIFPDVKDVNRDGFINSPDYHAFYREKMLLNKGFMDSYDKNKNGKLSDGEWSIAYEKEKDVRGFDKDPRFLERFFYHKRITKGLDLQGGIDLIYKVESPEEIKNAKEMSALVKKTMTVLKNRIDMLKITEPKVQRYRSDHIRVQLAGNFNEKQVKAIIGQTDLLKFMEVVDSKANPLAFGIKSQAKDVELIRAIQEKGKDGKPINTPLWYLVKKKALLTGDEVDGAYPQFDEFGKARIGFSFKPVGAKIWGKETARLTGRQVAIVMGGEVFMAPVVEGAIRDGQSTITGQFDLKYVKNIVDVLRAGSLPAKLIPVHENRIGATLGKDSVDRGFRAGVYGFALVFLLMFVWYKSSGFIANLALLFNLLLVMAIMIFLNATLTLPGIAGLILTVGMAVDANVIIFERLKEELKTGKSIRAAIDAGFAKAFSAIIDSNVTSLLTCIILFKYGSGPIQGFAVTLSIGILSSMFTAIFVVKVLLKAWYGNSDASTISI
ncbi:MAG: protein translocase subunit SecD [Candidatus Cloacimonadota bacterium]|nr:MAG: protein translocase subunit SecD [Candidatus Cloacimonadota bacterium]